MVLYKRDGSPVNGGIETTPGNHSILAERDGIWDMKYSWKRVRGGTLALTYSADIGGYPYTKTPGWVDTQPATAYHQKTVTPEAAVKKPQSAWHAKEKTTKYGEERKRTESNPR